MRTVALVIPAHQEARRLPRLLRAIRTTAVDDLHAAGLELEEVIVVDDASTDGTGAVLQAAAERDPRLRGLTAPPGRRGKGHALAFGIRQAQADAVLLVDVDLSAPLSETHKLTATAADVAIGSRALAGADVEDTPKTRELMGRTFNRFVRAATGLEQHDTQCPLKLLDTALARELTDRQLVTGFAFDVELLLRARRAGATIAEVPIAFQHDRDSRVRPVASAVSMASEVLRLAVRLRGRPARQRERHPGGQPDPAPDEPRLDGQR
jgi:glycosyltransferase involved in cell wall biosynthesis